MKLAAYRERATDDPLVNSDLKGVVVLVAGRPEIVEEVTDAQPEVRS